MEACVDPEYRGLRIGRRLYDQRKKLCQSLRDLLKRLAVQYNIDSIGGSHPTCIEDGDIHNVCYVALRESSAQSCAGAGPGPALPHSALPSLAAR